MSLFFLWRNHVKERKHGNILMKDSDILTPSLASWACVEITDKLDCVQTTADILNLLLYLLIFGESFPSYICSLGKRPTLNMMNENTITERVRSCFTFKLYLLCLLTWSTKSEKTLNNSIPGIKQQAHSASSQMNYQQQLVYSDSKRSIIVFKPSKYCKTSLW